MHPTPSCALAFMPPGGRRPWAAGLWGRVCGWAEGGQGPWLPMQPHGDSGSPSLFGEEGGEGQAGWAASVKCDRRGLPRRRAELLGGPAAPTSEAPVDVWLACRSACPAASFLGLGLGGWSPEEPRVDFQGED